MLTHLLMISVLLPVGGSTSDDVHQFLVKREFPLSVAMKTPDMSFAPFTIWLPPHWTVKGRVVQRNVGGVVMTMTPSYGVYVSDKLAAAALKEEIAEQGKPQVLGKWRYWISNHQTGRHSFLSFVGFSGRRFFQVGVKWPKDGRKGYEDASDMLRAAILGIE